MTCMAQTSSVCEDEIYKDFIRFNLMLTVAEKWGFGWIKLIQICGRLDSW